MELLLALAVLGFVAWWLRYNQLYRAGAVKLPFFSFGQSPGTKRVRVATRRPSKRAKNEVSPEVFEAIRRVAVYTHDMEVASRLLNSTHEANLSKSMNWCAEKTIEDLIRDRR